jgi:GT2 family glycosyltransferase
MKIGAVVIGRNEGARLESCLASLGDVSRVVYVDSGSTDGSVEMAQARGVEVVSLDMNMPFTAARARNAGLTRLREGKAPEFVQFVDGDCELRAGWLAAAQAFLDSHPDVAVVAGRRRERFPEATIYNAQCDREWDTLVGEALACGGDALMRMSVLDEVGGYDPTLIAGEEPEMCQRMRLKGWKIWRLDHEMTWHDAAMTRFSQFWKRARRAGHAYAEGAHLHGEHGHYVAQTRRALLWGAVLPVLIVILGLVWLPFFAVVLIYPLQVLRLAKRGGFSRAAFEEAGLLTLSKFAEARGVIEFHLRRLLGRRSGLIEYK